MRTPLAETSVNRAPVAQLSHDARVIGIHDVKSGIKGVDIAEQAKCLPAAISILYKYYQSTGSINLKPGSGPLFILTR